MSEALESELLPLSEVISGIAAKAKYPARKSDAPLFQSAEHYLRRAATALDRPDEGEREELARKLEQLADMYDGQDGPTDDWDVKALRQASAELTHLREVNKGLVEALQKIAFMRKPGATPKMVPGSLIEEIERAALTATRRAALIAGMTGRPGVEEIKAAIEDWRRTHDADETDELAEAIAKLLEPSA